MAKFSKILANFPLHKVFRHLSLYIPYTLVSTYIISTSSKLHLKLNLYWHSRWPCQSNVVLCSAVYCQAACTQNDTPISWGWEGWKGLYCGSGNKSNQLKSSLNLLFSRLAAPKRALQFQVCPLATPVTPLLLLSHSSPLHAFQLNLLL